MRLHLNHRISMITKALVAAAMLTGLGAAGAQTAAPSAAAVAEPSAAKKALIDKLVQLHGPAIENISRMVIQQPIGQLMQGAGAALQQVPADKREATGKAVEAEIRKFVDESVPMLRERAMKLAGPTWTPIFNEHYSEDELKTIIAWLESPVSKKYQQYGGELQNALGQKLVAETRGTLEPRFKALDQTVGKMLGVTPQQAPAAGAKPATPKK